MTQTIAQPAQRRGPRGAKDTPIGLGLIIPQSQLLGARSTG